MIFETQLSKNLKLEYTSILSFDEEYKVKTVRFWFTFFGESMFADFSKKRIDANQACVLFSEAPSELFDSFNEQITGTQANWEAIRDAFRKAEKEHELEEDAQ
jgi:hypothetical protein